MGLDAGLVGLVLSYAWNTTSKLAVVSEPVLRNVYHSDLVPRTGQRLGGPTEYCQR